MALSNWLHHITLHVPLTLPPMLTALGLWTWNHETPRTLPFVRWVGWALALCTTIVVLAGMWSAPGTFGGDGTEVLRDHRDLGVTAWCVVMGAVASYDYGVRHDQIDIRRLGICLWGVATLATIGAGHWGGLHEHAKLIPF